MVKQVSIFNAARTMASATGTSSSSALTKTKAKGGDSGKGNVVMSRYEDAMVVLPMVRYTKDAADMHTCHPVHQHDCMHLCYSPLLYQVTTITPFHPSTPYHPHIA